MRFILNQEHPNTPCKVSCTNCSNNYLIEYTYSDLDGEPFIYWCRECLVICRGEEVLPVNILHLV